MSSHSYVKVLIEHEGSFYELPLNGRDGEFQNFLINCLEPYDHTFHRPEKYSEIWYAHPFFGKSTIGNKISWIIDGDDLPNIKSTDKVVCFSNNLAVVNFHFYWYLSDRLVLQRLSKLDEQGKVNAIHRLRLVNLGYSVLNHVYNNAKEGSTVHLIYGHVGFDLIADGDKLLARGLRWCDITREKNFLKLSPRAKE